jgi:hypothetical protein
MVSPFVLHLYVLPKCPDPQVIVHDCSQAIGPIIHQVDTVEQLNLSEGQFTLADREYDSLYLTFLTAVFYGGLTGDHKQYKLPGTLESNDVDVRNER